MSDLDLLLEATGRTAVDSALEWVASGYPLAEKTDQQELMRAIVRLRANTAGPPDRYQDAIQSLARSLTRSDLDTATFLFRTEDITPAARFREALAQVARFSPNRRLARVNASAVVAAQASDCFVIEALCAVAGLSYSDLCERTDGLPADPAGSWSPAQVRAAFEQIDAVVSGKVASPLDGAEPTRPLDLMPLARPSGTGWAQVEDYSLRGVPYTVLLAQRAAGGAWLAHRNRTSNLVNHQVADQVCAALEERGLNHLRSSQVGGAVRPKDLQDLTGADKQVGIVVMDKAGKPAYMVVLASARDSGTASKSANRLINMDRNERLPAAVVVTGPGWANRNDTADLAIAFDGRVYSEAAIESLADEAALFAR